MTYKPRKTIIDEMDLDILLLIRDNPFIPTMDLVKRLPISHLSTLKRIQNYLKYEIINTNNIKKYRELYITTKGKLILELLYNK